MATKISLTKANLISDVKALIAFINTDLADIQSFVLNTQTMSRTALLALLQSLVDADAARLAAYNAWRNSVATEKAIAAQVKPVRQATKTFLQARYGKSSPTLLQAGFAPEQPSTKTAASKMLAVVKGATTRALRNPLTKAQRLALKGAATIHIVTGAEPTALSIVPEPAPAAQTGAILAAAAATPAPTNGSPHRS
jgi:hypothetical protein